MKFICVKCGLDDETFDAENYGFEEPLNVEINIKEIEELEESSKLKLEEDIL